MAGTGRAGSQPAEARERWRAEHGGYDPAASRLVAGWLAAVHALARPLARAGCPAWLLTTAALATAAGAAGAAAAGGRWLLAAAVLAAGGGLLDGLDGAVARLTGTASPVGALADALADRGGDVALLAALWLGGAPPAAVLAAAGATGLLEYARARAAAAGFAGIGRVTVGERPARLAVTCLALAAAGAAPHLAAAVTFAGAVLLAALAGVGSGQFVAAAVAGLRRPGPRSG